MKNSKYPRVRLIWILGASWVFVSNAAAVSAVPAVPSPSPSPDFRDAQSLRVECEAVLKKWIAHHSAAESALARCHLHVFNTECEASAQARAEVVAEQSACMKIPAIKQRKIPEMNCAIVQVPKHCGMDEKK